MSANNMLPVLTVKPPSRQNTIEPESKAGISERDVDEEPAWICTICWQPQTKKAKPKLLGTRSRIVCEGCWRAVLDLSICWVCGECIIRGDEVVSLGWCFWHRGCFGCLICKTKMAVPSPEAVPGKLDGSDGGVDLIKTHTAAGVELEEVPLCRVCQLETSGEKSDYVLEKGLETVTKSDGGLTRDRMLMLGELRGEPVAGMKFASRRSIRLDRKLRAKHTQDLKRDLTTFVNRNSSEVSRTQMTEPSQDDSNSQLLKRAADISVISGDGSADDSLFDIHSHSDGEEADFGQPRRAHTANSEETVYISVSDPLNQPAFKPSKTKPLPKWMHLLPSNVHCQREPARMRSFLAEAVQGAVELQTLTPNTPCSEDGLQSCHQDTPKTASPENEGVAITPRISPSPSGPSSPTFRAEDASSKTIQFDSNFLRKRSFTTGRTDNKSYTEDELSRTETRNEGGSWKPRYPTPFPRIDNSELEKDVTQSYFNYAMTTHLPTDGAYFNTPSIRSIDVPLTPPLTPLQLRDYSPIDTIAPRNLRASRTPSPSPIDIVAPNTMAFRTPSPSPLHSTEYIERYQPIVAEPAYTKIRPKTPEPILDKIRRSQRDRRSSEDNWDARKAQDRSSSSSIASSTSKFSRSLPPRRNAVTRELNDLFGRV